MDILIITGKQFTGASDTRLDLIGDKENVMLPAEVITLTQIPSSGTTTPASPCIGSSKKPTTSGSFNASSNSATLLYCTLIKPGV